MKVSAREYQRNGSFIDTDCNISACKLPHVLRTMKEYGIRARIGLENGSVIIINS